jgi:hypothetical protein
MKKIRWATIPEVNIEFLKSAPDFRMEYEGNNDYKIIMAYDIQWQTVNTTGSGWDAYKSYSEDKFEPTFQTKLALANGHATEEDIQTILSLGGQLES